MKQFFLKLRQFIEGPPDGIDQHPLSSKRVWAICCMVNAVILSYSSGSPELIGIWLGSGSAVLFGTAISGT